jgi:histidinol-phosphatase (PHP family)
MRKVQGTKCESLVLHSRLFMPIIADYHTHTPLCQHATGPLEAYVERGIELGLAEIGFADHNPLPNGLGANVRMKEEELDYYVRRVTDLQFQYRGQIEVRLGLEMDYVEGLEDYLARQISQYPWDYVIGSVHYLDRACRQGSWPRHYTGVATNLYTPYFRLLRQLAGSDLCDIIGHFDVPKRSGCHPTPEQSADITGTLEVIKKAGLSMEINTSGYRHPELPEPQPYPHLDIVKQVMAMEIPLLVNSDAHAPEQVGMKFAEIETFLRRKGGTRLVKFEKRERAYYAL